MANVKNIKQDSLFKSVQPKAEYKLVTPQMAEELLHKNIHNRSLDEARIARYTKELEKGRWLATNSGIGIDKDGNLVDGQHRLYAIIRSGIPAHLLVCKNLEPSVFSVIDTGKSRSVADCMSLNGYKHTTNLIAICKLKMIIEEYTAKKEPINFCRYNSGGYTHQDFLDELSSDPYIQECANYIGVSFPKIERFLARGIVAALYYIFSQKSKKDTNDFFMQLSTGIGLTENSVVYQLREHIASILMKGGSIASAQRISLTVQAWNLMRDGTHDARLVVNNNTVVDCIK